MAMVIIHRASSSTAGSPLEDIPKADGITSKKKSLSAGVEIDLMPGGVFEAAVIHPLPEKGRSIDGPARDFSLSQRFFSI